MPFTGTTWVEKSPEPVSVTQTLPSLWSWKPQPSGNSATTSALSPGSSASAALVSSREGTLATGWPASPRTRVVSVPVQSGPWRGCSETCASSVPARGAVTSVRKSPASSVETSFSSTGVALPSAAMSFTVSFPLTLP